jgi:hypothetical protein
MIADELTLAEKKLVLGDEQQKLSLFDIIFSNHRTIWLGNYSVEVRATCVPFTLSISSTRVKRISDVLLTQNRTKR